MQGSITNQAFGKLCNTFQTEFCVTSYYMTRVQFILPQDNINKQKMTYFYVKFSIPKKLHLKCHALFYTLQHHVILLMCNIKKFVILILQ